MIFATVMARPHQTPFLFLDFFKIGIILIIYTIPCDVTEEAELWAGMRNKFSFNILNILTNITILFIPIQDLTPKIFK